MVKVCVKEVQVSWEAGKPERESGGGECFSLITATLRKCTNSFRDK